MASLNIRLQHRPTGWNHPYEQDPDERFPRNPIVGEPFEIGVLGIPAGVFQTITCRWQPEGGAWRDLAAERLLQESDAEGDLWRATIPAQTEPGRVSYELIGVTAGGEESSAGIFSVDIAQWIAPDRMTGISVEGAVLHIKYGFNALPFEVHYRIWLDLEHDLICELSRKSWDSTPNGALGVWHESNDDADVQTWVNSALQVQIDSGNQAVRIMRDNIPLLAESRSFELLVSRDKDILGYRRSYGTQEEELYLGLGERFNSLDQRGNHLDTRVFEQYREQKKRTYIPVPFLLSSRGWGYFQDTLRRTSYDFPGGYEDSLVITQECDPDFSGRSVIFSHPVWEDNVRAFVRKVAMPAMPPIWSFGLWMSSNEWYFQEEVLRQMRLMGEHDIPATVLVIEAWSDEENFYIWNDAQYELKDPAERFTLSDFTFPADGCWPDPKEMTDQLHGAGLKLILWQIPVLKFLKDEDIEKYGPNPQHDRDEDFMVEQGYCVRNADGSPYNVPPMIWFGNSLVWDVTHPDAVDWWLSRRQYLVEEIGVDGFKTDGGEHLWGQDMLFADGRTSADLINDYPKIYQQAYFDFANRYRPDGAVNFSRAGYTGSQTAPMHWAGDQSSTWEAFRAVLLAGQNLGLSGVPYWGWDIGGFSGPIPSAELYLRSTAAATFAPVMQYHSEHNQHKPVSVDRTPWNIQVQTGDERVLPIFRRYAHLRMNLLPYLYSEAVHTSQTGLPMFGCPLVRFEDRAFLSHPYQFLCGRYFMVAPVTEPEVTEWPVYLPKGRWVDFWNGKIYEGMREYILPVDLGDIPVFVREGTILPFNLNSDLQFTAGMSNVLDRYDTLTLVLFGETDETFSYNWHDYLTSVMITINADTDIERDLSVLKNKACGIDRKRI